MRSIQETKDLVAREQGYSTWESMMYANLLTIKERETLTDIAMSNYAFLARQDLLNQVKKSLHHLPEAVRIVEETEYRTYPEE